MRIAARRRIRYPLILFAITVGASASTVFAHPLGNFTINHFARIEPGPQRIAIRYVIDMAEIPAFQELQKIDTDGDGSQSAAELSAYALQASAILAKGILLNVDAAQAPLSVVSSTVALPPGAGGLPTLRIECDFAAGLNSVGAIHRMKFEDANYGDRLGWREIVAVSAPGLSIFDSTAFGSAVTDELNAYPEDSLSAPLDERAVEFSFTQGAIPSGGAALRTRDGRSAAQPRDRLAELIAVPELTPILALLGLVVALGLGGLHAMSPGHGKTVVGAYLVGSRGTARHAAFLGLTVTITHTAGVFALGLVTLFASEYVVPEKLFPILSLISGGIVLSIGLSLFIRRLRDAFNHSRHPHDHNGDHSHVAHEHSYSQSSHGHHHHSHGGKERSHLPPGGDGSPITWRSLLALGISGGLLPCPSALVVMLSAISLHRIGYGILLVIAFSIGLAATLTAVGLMFVYVKRFMKRPLALQGLMRALPIASAFVIACAGAAICYEALSGAGPSLGASVVRFFGLVANSISRANPVSTASMLAFGLVFGLKHAVEADHLAAVSTIVSERKSLLSSSLVGGLWGLGHTISLLIAGAAILLFHVKIGERTVLALEFCVGLMLIGLGANGLRKLLGGGTIHTHLHRHGYRAHFHPHFHREPAESAQHTHHGLSLNARPLLVGMVHGIAGSTALMLLVLSTVSSRAVGFAFIALFGVGSIAGMMMMSLLVSIPLQLTANRFKRTHRAVQTLTAIFSLGLGMMLAYHIGFEDGLFG